MQISGRTYEMLDCGIIIARLKCARYYM